ncbi:MAG: Palmitoyltransferase [Pleopsidium flavum]|nr:MAG: Palmitoyltransferase [Pleopsidium flavum]
MEILSWFWPFAATSSNMSGLKFEVNGFEDLSLSWPPPDPDRIPRMPRSFQPGDAFTYNGGLNPDQNEIEAFQSRQKEDMKRFQSGQSQAYRRQPFHNRYSSEEKVDEDKDIPEFNSAGSSGGEEGWRNSEGDRLRDFGVDEDVEFYDEDNVPLAELLRRRKEAKIKNSKVMGLPPGVRAP